MSKIRSLQDRVKFDSLLFNLNFVVAYFMCRPVYVSYAMLYVLICTLYYTMEREETGAWLAKRDRERGEILMTSFRPCHRSDSNTIGN